MPLHPVLHEGNATAFMRVRDDAVRARGFKWRATKGSNQVIQVMAANFPYGPAKRTPAIGQGLQAYSALRFVALLKTIPVHNDGQVIQAKLRCRHCGLPVTALLQLAVSGQHKRAPGSASDPGGLCRADTNRQPV